MRSHTRVRQKLTNGSLRQSVAPLKLCCLGAGLVVSQELTKPIIAQAHVDPAHGPPALRLLSVASGRVSPRASMRFTFLVCRQRSPRLE